MVKYYNLLPTLKVATAMLVETLKKFTPFMRLIPNSRS
jgi:hypothetical protein